MVEPGALLALGLTGFAVHAAPPDQTGTASGLVNTTQRVGAALGVTALLVAADAWTRGHGGDIDALADGLRLGFAGAATLATLGVVCALTLFTPSKRDRFGRNEHGGDLQTDDSAGEHVR